MNTKVDFPLSAYPVSSEVLQAIEQFEQQQLSWLSGYCAGLAKGKAQTQADSQVVNSLLADTQSQAASVVSVTQVQVLYASQTGNAQSVAEKLFAKLQQTLASREQFEIDVANVNDFKVKNLAKKQVVIIVTSTHGEGEPPDDAIEFLELLSSKRAPKLSSTKHAVLGLGDSSYEFFCQTGKDFETQLSRIGSTPLVERVDCDLDYEIQVEQWIEQIFDALNQGFAGHGHSTSSAGLSIKPSSAQTESSQYSKNNPFSATILSSQRITADDADKNVQHIELSIEGSGLSYQPGDGVGVWADNDKKVVDEILKSCQIKKDSQASFKGQELSIKTLLTSRLEITLISKVFLKKYLAILQQQGSDKVAQIELILIQEYSQYIKHHQIADVLAIASVELSAQQLVDLLNPIKPRIYSIASSQNAYPDEIHITVKLVESHNQKHCRKGTASRFLIEELQEEQTVNIFIEKNDRFRLPAEETPMLMVGPGTGIAPFRAFLQEREELEASGENWLFFGNSHFNSEFLYQLELQSFLKSGLLAELSVAFSRDQEEKIYVQDRLRERGEAVWDWLHNRNASFYVCGDMNYMAKDVEAALLEIIQEHGELSEELAVNYLSDLKKAGRYQRDVY